MAHNVFLTNDGDGKWLAVSIDSPRFCVGAPTREEAYDKAQRAVAYYETIKGSLPTLVRPTQFHVVSPFYEEKELCVVG